MPAFLIANEASIRTIKKVGGFISGKELIDKRLVFWTITLWESEQAMKYFRNNEPHKQAMRKLSDWCDEGAYVHWLQDYAVIPAWNMAHQKLLTEGKVTKVKNPSPQHSGMDHPPPVWTKTERTFKFTAK